VGVEAATDVNSVYVGNNPPVSGNNANSTNSTASGNTPRNTGSMRFVEDSISSNSVRFVADSPTTVESMKMKEFIQENETYS